MGNSLKQLIPWGFIEHLLYTQSRVSARPQWGLPEEVFSSGSAAQTKLGRAVTLLAASTSSKPRALGRWDPRDSQDEKLRLKGERSNPKLEIHPTLQLSRILFWTTVPSALQAPTSQGKEWGGGGRPDTG